MNSPFKHQVRMRTPPETGFPAFSGVQPSSSGDNDSAVAAYHVKESEIASNERVITQKEADTHQERMINLSVGKVEEVVGHVLTLTSLTALSRKLMMAPNGWAKLVGVVIALLAASYAAFSTLPGWVHRVFSSGDVVGSWWSRVAVAIGYATPSRVKASLASSGGFSREVVGSVSGWLSMAKPLKFPFLAAVVHYETGGNPRMRGPQGEYGIFQLNKEWFEKWCSSHGETPSAAAINVVKYSLAAKDYIITYFNPSLDNIQKTSQSPLVKFSLQGIDGRAVAPKNNLFVAHALWKDGAHGKLSVTKAVNAAARTLTSAMMIRPDTLELVLNNTSSTTLAQLNKHAPDEWRMA